MSQSLPLDEADIELPPADIKRFTNAILTKYGYDFTDYALSSFKRRVILVLKRYGMASMDVLINRVVNDIPFFDQVLRDITVNTTEMFRDPTFFRALRTQVVPILASRPEFNIWHAACSTGEEVFSLAILLKEEGLLSRANIYATDINHQVLKKAAQGRFALRNVPLFTQNYEQSGPKAALTDYYKTEGNEMVFDPTLIKDIKFKHHDLAVDDHFYKFDLILCRNVMIYFNQQLQNRVFEMLHQSLFVGGYLTLGAKESMVWCRIADKFETVNDLERIYRKTKA